MLNEGEIDRGQTWKRFHEKELTHSMAHYLQAVATLARETGFASVGDIAERLGVSKSGVTSMLRTLRARGLVTHEPYGPVQLTVEGRRLAERTESSRRVLTLFFTNILGLPSDTAMEDACMIEHLVSPESMVQFLKLTSFIQSDHPVAGEFRRSFLDYRQTCNHGAESGECEICAGSCLRDSFDPESRDGGGRSAR